MPEPDLPFSDRPLRQGESDLLERGPFVANFAEIISQAPANDSIVFALYGKWGEGKTSALTLLLDELSGRIERDEPAPLVIKFNPWVFSGRENLFQAFFEDIGNAIGTSDIEGAAEKAKRWKRLGAYSNLVGGTLNTVDSVLNILGASVPGWKLLGKFLGNVEEIADQAAAAEDASPDHSLADIRKELEEELVKLERPILVVLDDLDRLPPGELVEIFQLLKSTADMPNVHYLLLCDRANIERSLEAQKLPAEYLEKIVQFGAPLPAIPDARLRELLLAQLAELFKEFAPNDTRIGKEFWDHLADSALPKTFTSLREVKRYLGELRMAFPVFCRGGHFELNPGDFLRFQALRIFSPGSIDLLFNKRALFNRKPGLFIDSGKKETVSDQRTGFINDELPKQFTGSNSSRLNEMARELLLTHGADRSHSPISAEQRHFVSFLWFDTYFTLENPHKFVSAEEIGKIRGQLDADPTQLPAVTTPIIARTGYESMARCLDVHFRGDIVAHGPAILVALLSVGTAAEDDNPFTVLPGVPVFDYFAQWLFVTPAQEREPKTIEILELSKNHQFFAFVLYHIEHTEGLQHNLAANIEPFKDRLGKATGALLADKSERGDDLLEEEFWYSHDAWARWGPRGKLKNWIRSVTTSDGSFRKYLESIGEFRTYDDEKDGKTKEYFWLYIKRLEPFPSLEDGIRRCRRLGATSADEREKLLYRDSEDAFRKAADYRRGKRILPRKFPGFIAARIHQPGVANYGLKEMAIITACNPNGEEISEAENTERTDQLRAHLEERDLAREEFPVGAPDGSHLEQSFLVNTDLPGAIVLGREWGQAAVFVIFGGKRVELVGCGGEGRLNLGPLSERYIAPDPEAEHAE